MSTTAELRELTSQLVEALDLSPYAQLAQQVADAADALAQRIEAVYALVVTGAVPELIAACQRDRAGQPSPIQAAPFA